MFKARRIWRTLVASAAVALAACSAEQAPDADAVRTTTDTVGGVVHVANAGATPAWRLEPLLTIEDAGGEPFGALTGVVADEAGAVFVADRQAKHIYHFAPDGRYLGTVGREGGGPGEFRSMYSLAWVGEYLATLDAGNGRVTLVTTEGGAGPTVRWGAITGTGFALEQTGPGEAYAMFPLRTPGEPRSRRVYLRITGEGVADTLAGRHFELPAGDGPVVCEGGPDRAIHFFTVPHRSVPLSARAPGRQTVLGWTGEYRLAFVSAEGDTVRVVTRDVPNPALPDAEWAETEGRWAKFQERARGSRCEPSGIQRPASKNAIASVFFDDAGRMWVEAHEESGHRFDVFDATGALVGHLPAPDRDRAVTPYVRGDRLYYVAKDSLDVHAVRVARIENRSPAAR